ncbi:kinetochore-associated Ndc80 complex subunit spc25, partial [Quaeritorhiza haematococci]
MAAALPPNTNTIPGDGAVGIVPSSTSAHASAVQHLSSQAQLTGFDELRNNCASFLQTFDTWVLRRKQEIIEQRNVRKLKTAQLQETHTQLVKQLDIYREKEYEHRKVVEKERKEADDLRRTIDDLTRTTETRQHELEDISSKVINLAAEVRRRREALLNLRKRRQQEINSKMPELLIYEDKLALKIVPVKEDHMRFSFTHVNETEWNQEYYFDIDVSDRAYK